MSDIQLRDMGEQELETVCGGSGSHGNYSFASSGVSVTAAASGGYLHMDAVFADTKTISVTAHGESVSVSVGFAVALAL